MQPFSRHFDRLVDKYSVPFVFVEPGAGRYDAGVYLAGEAVETPLYGAILPLAERKVYQPGGSFTEKDRSLIVKAPLPVPLAGAKVRHKGNLYSVEEETDHSDYGDVAVYLLRWVSSLSKGGGAP